MNFKHLFYCSMFVVIGAAQSTGFRVLGRVNYIGAAALQTHVRHCTEFKVPPGLKLGKISEVPVSRKSKKLQEEWRLAPDINFSDYTPDSERDVLYRISKKKGLQSHNQRKKEAFPLAGVELADFEKADNLSGLYDIKNAIGLVSVVFDLGEDDVNFLGTGFAIREDAILTAAHNITLDMGQCGAATNMIARTVEFYPKYTSIMCHNTLQIKKFRMPPEWEVGRDSAYDFALLFLDEPKLEAKLTLASIKEHMALPIPVRVAGYPGNISQAGVRKRNVAKFLYMNSGKLTSIDQSRRKIAYDALTDAGMSGGPIFVRELPIALGVHTKGGWDLNRGIHYADHMISYLDKWFAERDNATQDAQVKLERLIAELAQSEEEKEHLLSCKDILEKYPSESWRSHLVFYLEICRKKR